MCVSKSCSVISLLFNTLARCCSGNTGAIIKMRLPALLVLFVCAVFVSSGFRTAFGQDDLVQPVQKSANYETGKAVENLSGEVKQSGNPEAASSEPEASGKLKVDPVGQSETELLDGEEHGVDDKEIKDDEVEIVPNKPETATGPGKTRSGNLDTFYGKRSLCVVKGKNGVCSGCSCECSVRVKNMFG